MERSQSQIHLYRNYPEFSEEEEMLQFRLTYEGPLRPSGNNNRNAAHKHEIRKAFHPQLRNLWSTNGNINELAHLKMGFIRKGVMWRFKGLLKGENPGDSDEREYIEYLADNYKIQNHQIIPLVTSGLSLWCGLDILFLRSSAPGKILSSGDIDNRIKTLFDALKRPTQLSDFGPQYQPPHESEQPFFVLLEDDSLVAKLSVETDMMLEPLIGGIPEDTDTRLVITVSLRPMDTNIVNMGFG